jgi:hypothetical protein
MALPPLISGRHFNRTPTDGHADYATAPQPTKSLTCLSKRDLCAKDLDVRSAYQPLSRHLHTM